MTRYIPILRLLHEYSDSCLDSVIKHGPWHYAVEKWVLLFRADYPVSSTLLNTHNMGRMNVKPFSVRSKTFSKDRQLSRKQDHERSTLLFKAKQLCTQWKGELLFLPSCGCLYTCQKQTILPKLEEEKHWAQILHCNQGGPTQIQETLHIVPTSRLGAWIQKNGKDTLPMPGSVLPAALPSQSRHTILK